jgi:hypothetical protein
MAFDEAVAERVRKALAGSPDVVEKRMFGGIAFMVRGNMWCGVIGDRLMLRVGPKGYETAGVPFGSRSQCMDRQGDGVHALAAGEVVPMRANLGGIHG